MRGIERERERERERITLYVLISSNNTSSLEAIHSRDLYFSSFLFNPPTSSWLLHVHISMLLYMCNGNTRGLMQRYMCYPNLLHELLYTLYLKLLHVLLHMYPIP